MAINPDAGPSVEFAGTERFEVHRRLGAGGMGVVYEAFDKARNARVALKTLREMDPQSLYRFKREFRALQDLEHPNLVSLGELIEVDGRWFFTMELIEGSAFLDNVRTLPVTYDPELRETAAELRRSKKPGRSPAVPHPTFGRVGYNEARLRAGLRGLARGLSALHAAGKVHRDVKPSNVLVARDGRVVLLDFGLITEQAADVTADAVVVGTAPYMAPEQGAAKAVGPPADWYSMGVLLYEALTGRLPFDGSPLQIIMDKQTKEPPPPSHWLPDVPADLDELCAALLRIEADDRPTAEQILGRLGDQANSKPRASTSHGSSARIFVGREAELDILREAFAASRRQHAIAVRVHGESGIGKSALIRRFTQEVTADYADAVVLTGRCYEQERVPYNALDGVVDSLSRFLRQLPGTEVEAVLPRFASTLPRVFPVLGMVEEIAQAPSHSQFEQDPSQARAQAFATLRELFERLTDRRPVVVVIDDVQWSDADSRVLLTDLLRPPDPPRLLLLGSSRADPSEGFVDALPAEQRRVIDLEPLPQHDAQRLTEALLRRAGVVEDDDAAMITADAHGHPLFIDELVRHAAIAGALDPGVRLDDAIWHRVQTLPADTQRLLQLVCLAGAPLRYDTYARASRSDSTEFNRQLSVLRAANLVRRSATGDERFEPYHNRVRDAVVGHVEADQAREHHSRLAAALGSAAPGSVRPELLLHHLQRAGQPEKAAEYAEMGAVAASRGLAFDQAAELYAIALRTGHHTTEHERSLRLGMAEALTNAGRGVEAAHAYLQAADGADLVTRRECQRHAAQQLLITGHLVEGEETLASLLEEANVRLPPTRRRALYSLVRERALLRLRGLRFSERHEREIAGSELAKLDVIQVVGTGMAMVDNILGALFQTRSLRMALRIGERRRIAYALGMEAIFVGSQGGRALARARKLVDKLRGMADAADDPLISGYSLAGEGVWHYLSGEFPRGLELLEQAERTFRTKTVGTQMELNNTRLFHLFCLRHIGALAECRRLFDRYVRDAERRGDLYAGTTYRRSCNRVWLALDQPQRAHVELDRTAWTPPDRGFHFQHWYELEARAELSLYEGDCAARLAQLRPQFDALRKSLLPRIQIVRTAARWSWARFHLGLASHPEHRAEALKTATQLARKLCAERIAYAHAWGLMIAAGVQHARGNDAKTRSVLAQIIALGDEHHMELVANTARLQLGRLVGGDEGAALGATAQEWMQRQKVANPDRFTDMALPLPPP